MLTSAALKLSEVVSGPFLLNVPPYQRPFSWGEAQVEQLLDDLLDASGVSADRASEECYFLGTILLMDPVASGTTKLGPKMPRREFDVVDGQQRLATIMTLFCVLRDLETSDRKHIARRVQQFVKAQTGSRFRRAERFRLRLAPGDQDLFERLILEERSTRSEPDRPFITPSERAMVKMRDLTVATMEELSEAQRTKLFDFIAERCNIVVIVSQDIDHAHRMFVVLNERGKKLQRDDIIKADLLGRAASVDAGWIADTWDKNCSKLGHNFEQFFSHLRTIYGQDNARIVSGVRRVIDQSGGAAPFVTNIFQPLSASYHTILTGTAPGLPDVIRQRLVYLNRLADGDWAPAAMLALKDWTRDPERASTLIAEIDRMAHLMRMSCTGAGKRVRRFGPIIAAIRSGEPIDENHAAFQMTRDETRAINFHMKDLHKRGPKICKLLLLRLGDCLAGQIQDVDPDIYTIEHILPQRPSSTSEWRRIFPTAEDRSRCVESLGNLVLVTQRQNDKARNGNFAEKKAIYQDAPADAPIAPITRDVMSTPFWTREAIEQREDRLLVLLASLFRVDIAPVMPTAPQSAPMVAGAAPATKRASAG